MDLSDKAVETHWQARGSSISQVIRRMENCQNWTVDAELIGWLERLGEAMSSPEVIHRMASCPEDAAEFLAWISTGKAIAILDELDQANFGTAAAIVASANEMSANPAQRVFVEGLRVLAQVQVLSAVFSPDRMALVEAAVMASREARRD